jgi:hypothetical protein
MICKQVTHLFRAVDDNLEETHRLRQLMHRNWNRYGTDQVLNDPIFLTHVG